ncbi:hypothetical protein ACQEUU_29980 [Nonomuraea sp. CA-218870]|uniref:hypothetical protein n=1 Tax=Nonomuraea sp. CA-218870 TaxID=3239998 RepID=UPI003D93FDF9
MLTRRIREDLDASIGHHAASGLPGDSTSVLLLYLTLNWLIVERLTVPVSTSRPGRGRTKELTNGEAHGSKMA